MQQTSRASTITDTGGRGGGDGGGSPETRGCVFGGEWKLPRPRHVSLLTARANGGRMVGASIDSLGCLFAGLIMIACVFVCLSGCLSAAPGVRR